ncbi:peptidoglycan bridge formation glycyltransferase FemA/FemB family protein [Planococcus antarcticus]|uniref:peptidoglycan bridge formation glycyltransferase FemA/FemB family protein n=1 Tax=Planococcus antarcticus TaxID=161360 RepID=UPI0038B3D171
MILLEDLYFKENYCRLYEEIEGGTCEVFEFENDLGSIRHMFMKREIPVEYKENTYYDLTTPYGYGGPLITHLRDGGQKEKLVAHFSKAFRAYCAEHNIISEFVRFHPIKENAKDFTSCFDVHFRRHTTGVTLKGFEDPVQEEFSSSTRKKIRKALRDGVTYRITVNPDNLEQFKEIYLKTMERIGADPMYFFNEAYFSNCLKYFGDQLVLVEVLHESRVIGTELHFHTGPILHTHLSGSLDEYSHLNPVYVMTYAIALWAKQQGVELIHSGGGLTTASDDSLYLFKKKFGRNTEFDYYTGYKIWNEEIYQQLAELSKARPAKEFFPAYR